MIKAVTLRNFRNIELAQLSFNEGFNVIVGDNGQGKTNLVEALVLLSMAKSFRIRDEQAMIKDQTLFSKITASLLKNDKTIDLECVISEAGKFLTINHLPLKKMSELMGVCNIVLFQPDDLNFFTQTPRKRRKDVDYELGKLSDDYLKHVLQAQKLLNERNAYLKEKKIDHEYLDIITQQLVAASIPIMTMRQAFVAEVEGRVNDYYEKLAGLKQDIQFEYHACIPLDIEDYKQVLYDKMHDSLHRDVDFKMTHVGIHRDDFIFKFHHVPIINVASQGQRRLLMIAYKLALVDLIAKRSGQFPVLCLDDLFSELDETRRRLTLACIHKEMQVFITTTDLDFVKELPNYNLYRVLNGQIEMEVI